MKKTLALAMMMVTILTLTACGGNSSSGSKDRVVNVCSWGEYIDESLIDQFEEETGIKVNYQFAEDMLAELNYDNIPNYALIDDQYKNLSYDPDNKYTVPYTWVTLGIIYNTTMVDEEITSWDAMFDEKYAGQVLMIRNSRDALAAALLDLGYDINTTDEAQIREAYELLSAAKNNGVYQAFVMD